MELPQRGRNILNSLFPLYSLIVWWACSQQAEINSLPRKNLLFTCQVSTWKANFEIFHMQPHQSRWSVLVLYVHIQRKLHFYHSSYLSILGNLGGPAQEEWYFQAKVYFKCGRGLFCIWNKHLSKNITRLKISLARKYHLIPTSGTWVIEDDICLVSVVWISDGTHN